VGGGGGEVKRGDGERETRRGCVVRLNEDSERGNEEGEKSVRVRANVLLAPVLVHRAEDLHGSTNASRLCIRAKLCTNLLG